VRRYPLRPLAAAAGLRLEQLPGRLNLSGSTWIEYRDRGVSERVADRLATKLELHAYMVWPEMLDDAIGDASFECAGPECVDRFVPRRSDQRYCSIRCQRRAHTIRRAAANRAAMRARYWANPEAQRQRSRRYFEENHDYVLKRQRAYDRRKAAQGAG
jgi:hypothetical protein